MASLSFLGPIGHLSPAFVGPFSLDLLEVCLFLTAPIFLIEEGAPLGILSKF